MGDAMAAAVARSMRQGNVVVHFRGVDISNNALTDRSIAPLLRQISLPSARMHLHELVLNRNHIGHGGAAALATLISGKVVDHKMQRRRVGQGGPAALAALVRATWRSVTSMSLWPVAVFAAAITPLIFRFLAESDFPCPAVCRANFNSPPARPLCSF